jgi:hypothetical protein
MARKTAARRQRSSSTRQVLPAIAGYRTAVHAVGTAITQHVVERYEHLSTRKRQALEDARYLLLLVDRHLAKAEGEAIRAARAGARPRPPH